MYSMCLHLDTETVCFCLFMLHLPGSPQIEWHTHTHAHGCIDAANDDDDEIAVFAYGRWQTAGGWRLQPEGRDTPTSCRVPEEDWGGQHANRYTHTHASTHYICYSTVHRMYPRYSVDCFFWLVFFLIHATTAVSHNSRPGGHMQTHQYHMTPHQAPALKFTYWTRNQDTMHSIF